MEAPPQFTSLPPAKKKNNVLTIILVLLGLIGICCAGTMFFLVRIFNKVKGTAECTAHYALAYAAANKYASAHGGLLPDAKNWQDEIAPFYDEKGDRASAKKFMDIGDPMADLGCAAGDSGPATGMAFNSALSKKSLSSIDSPATIMFYEVAKTGRNQSKPYKPLAGMAPQTIMGTPRSWLWVTVKGQVSSQSSGGFRQSTSVNLDPSGDGSDKASSSGDAGSPKPPASK